MTEPERIPGKPIAWVLAGTVLAVILCAAIVWVLPRSANTGARTEPLELRPSAQPFSQPLAGEAERAAARRELDAWSWSDRAHGRVRMPVSVAIDRYLEHAR